MIWMARHYRFGRHTWPTAVGMHAVGVVVFTFMHAVLTIAMRVPIQRFFGRPSTFGAEFQELFFLYFDWEMMTYWAIVGLSHAIDFHNEARERELTTDGGLAVVISIPFVLDPESYADTDMEIVA